MNVLELFSGTGSVRKCCDQLGWNCISLDFNKKFNPTHCCDILDFNYKQYDKDYFSLIWASPDCCAYSHLQSCWLGRMKKGGLFTKEKMEEDKKEADKLVIKTLEIINYFNVDNWFIENPFTSDLKNRYFMKDIPYYKVSYCMYSDWGYKKDTNIWTNKKDFKPLVCNGQCGNMIDINQHSKILGNGYELINGKKVSCNTKEKRKHLKISDGGSKKKEGETFNNGTTKEERFRVPQELIFSLFLS